jgi:hypothetical protein
MGRLKTREEIDIMRAEARTKALDTYNAIREYYVGNDTILLSEKQEEIRMRWHAIYLKKLSRFSDHEIVSALMKEFNISQRTAYQDVNNSKRLFGVAGKSDRDLNRQIAEKMALETYQVAKEQRLPRDMAAATKAFIDASGVKDDLSDLPDFSKLEPSTFIVMLDPETKKLIEKLTSLPSVNLSSLFPTEDIAYEEE